MRSYLFSEINELIGSLDFNWAGKVISVSGSFLEKFKGHYFNHLYSANDDCPRNSTELLEEICGATSDSLQQARLKDNSEILYRCVRTQRGYLMTILRVDDEIKNRGWPDTNLRKTIESYSQKFDDYFLILIDVEDVLSLNASIGFHAATRRLERIARSIEDLVSDIRHGIFLTVQGGQYAIVGSQTTESELKDIHKNILLATTSEFGDEGLFNAGMGETRYAGNDVESVILAAQYNLKKAKRSQKRDLVVSMSGAAYPFMTNAREQLVRALDNNEFLLHYQPIVSLEKAEVVAVEALARWEHPSQGVLPPSQFIEQLQKYKLMNQFSVFLLRQACADLHKWFSGIQVSINFSPEQLEHADFTRQVVDLLQEHQVPASAIQIEVTEDRNHTVGVTNTVRQLTDSGISVALDDYGTGYCNVLAITSIMANTIKLDRSLISNQLFTRHNPEFVKSVVKMCKSLNKKVVVEGIETKEQYDFVVQCGADMGQGYYFAKPMPPEYLSLAHLNVKSGVSEYAKCGKR